MPNEPDSLPTIKHVQVKLSQGEYELLEQLAEQHQTKVTPYARALFLEALRRERAAAALRQANRPARKP